MAILHLVFHPGFEAGDLRQCLAYAGKGDAIMLLAGGVCDACRNFSDREELEVGDVSIYVLEEDLRVRGILLAAVDPGIKIIGMADFVDLTVQYSRILTW